jgi:transposase
MACIIKKIKNKRPYYYAVQSGRVNGKPRIVWQKYLGTLDDIIARSKGSGGERAVDIFQAGGVAAMLRMIQKIRLIEIVDAVVPKRDQGPSVGEYLALAIINRVLAPCSKLKMPDWYRDTVLFRLWKYSPESFSSQNFWQIMDMISEEQVNEIQEKITKQVKKKFTINPELLLYDTSNFFTFIATGNKRNTIAQRGRNKKKRGDLRQVGLALLITKDFQIPLFHKTYQGNLPDRGIFFETAAEIMKHNKKIFSSTKDSTWVFDKGNISDNAMENLIVSEQHFVCAVPNNTQMGSDLFNQPIEEFTDVKDLSGTKAFHCDVTLWSKKLKAVLTYSESFFTSQLTELTLRMQKCQKALHDFDVSISKGTKKSRKELQKSAKGLIAGGYTKEIFEVDIYKKNGVFRVSYQINQEKFNYLTKHVLGRTLIISNRFEWSLSKIISTYRNQISIEDTFKKMNNADYLHWQPAFHWTDQKIKVHGLYCVLALLITSLTHKIVAENGIEISFLEMLSELSNIREVAIFDSSKVDKRCKGELAISRMSSIQKKLAEVTEINLVLTRYKGNTERS